MNSRRPLKLRARNVMCFLLLLAIALGGSQATSLAFSLLGPFDFWMTTELGQRRPSDAGAPVNLGSGYRWNVPLVTYGFDPQFVAYFGTQGVAAVEQAFAVLNDLPPASRVALTNYAPYAKSLNATAAAMQIIDLKSMTLALLLEQMGLAAPTRHVWVLRSRRTESIAGQLLTNYVIVMRNFAPHADRPTNRVNDFSFTYDIREVGPPLVADAFELPVGLSSVLSSAVADMDLHPGELYTGLSQDDVGGLRYLLARSKARVERLPMTVHSADGGCFKRRALRPGVEHIRFTKLRRRPDGTWRAITNNFVDRIRLNGATVRQNVRRIIRTPDILFQVRALLPDDPPSTNRARILADCGIPLVERSTVARWKNYSQLNADNPGVGPGIISPGAVITLAAITYDPETEDPPCVRWGSFGLESIDLPTIYPVPQSGP